ncbi:MAG: carboxypeptidase regulatory-like domain-containing protein [Candidatus Sulfotelmatobacter sp.]
MFNFSRPTSRLFLLAVIALSALLFSSVAFAQTTVATGSIVGTVTDPSGAVVSGAKVTVTNIGTNEVINLTSNSSGAFNSGALAPGNYKVQVTLKGFSTISENVVVQVGNTSTVNAKLQVGQESTVVEVQGTTLAVNTEQSEVQGVLTSAQIENLPVNGRNFLDLAQLEPGVQIQDGQNFDPTKAGYSSISFGGRFGRTARIEVDGVDVSDETVGTTTQDIPASGIQEFQLGQSSLDLSNDLTSSGAVNVTTKSGTNQYHGEAFGLFRDRTVGGASTPGGGDLPFQRSQYGGNLGGAVIKDKLFFFLDGERIKQDSFAPVLLGDPFSNLNGGFSVPFRDDELLGRVDYNLGHNARAFYRYDYFKNSLPSDFGLGYSVYDNKDITRTNVVGVDFNTGSFTHSIRFSYMKFQNQIVDATSGNSALPDSGIGVEISSSPSGLWLGPNLLAPQSTPQSNHQFKYDGSKSIHSHILRYGVSFNHIQGGGFADFYGSAPRFSNTISPDAGTCVTGTFANPCAGSTAAFAAAGPNAGGDTNPLNYPVQNVRFGDGLGFNTLSPALGFPAGGLGPDNRLGFYIGDSWKVKSNLTLSLGLRYDRDTGRTDSDLPAIPEINAAFPSFGDPVKQANLNFAPQFGFAWDPAGNGKTVIRGGAGLYYENVIYNNVLFDRPYRLQTGAFNQVFEACVDGQPEDNVTTTTGIVAPPNGVCNNNGAQIPISQAIPAALSFWHNTVLAGNPLNLSAPNPNYIGNYLGAGLGVPLGLFGPNYKSPRALQINFGIQREVRRGMIFSADYLRNIETKTLLGIDINHVGDIKNFNVTAAQNAVNSANAAYGCTTITCAAAAGATSIDYTCGAACTGITGEIGGLASDTDFGQACIFAIGAPCAFGGLNPNESASTFLLPVGRSVYNALQMKLVQNVQTPFRGVKAMNFQVAYSLSRFDNTGGSQASGTAGDNDQDFVLSTADNNNTGRYFGPSLLDRTHQLSFGGYADLPLKFRLGVIGHFYSPLSSSIDVPNFGNGPGEIFRSDFTGDGTVQDPVPGTHFGQFDRGTNAAGLTNLINQYNSTYGNQVTPAGNVLVSQGVASLADLQSIGLVAPTLSAPVAGQTDFTWLKTMDLNLSWRFSFHERFTIEPSVAAFNVFNFANFNLPPNTMSGLLTGGVGSINGTSKLFDGSGYPTDTFRVGNGTGVYAVGAARQIEFGLKLSF